MHVLEYMNLTMTKKGVKAPVALEADLNAAVIYVSTDLKQ